MMKIRRLGVLAAAVGAAAIVGCEAPGNPRLADLVSPDRTYLVRLTGRPTSAAFLEHRMRVEIFKNGALHLPMRMFYVAGLFDTSFQDRFGPPDWPSAHTLRLPGRGTIWGPPETLYVRNLSGRVFRSIRIETSRDMFFVLDLAPGAEVTLPMTAPRDAWPNWFDVVVDSGPDEPMLRGHGTFESPRRPRPPFVFRVSVTAEGVEVEKVA
jgi:hypothetical protein